MSEERVAQTQLECLLRKIDAAETADRLRPIFLSGVSLLAPQAEGYLDEPERALMWNARLNRLHDAVIRRAVRLAEAALAAEGLTPPGGYDVLLFGSGGRGEQSVYSDQDNGIVYETPAPGREEEFRSFFLKLGSAIQESLDRAGYPPCPGKVVCGEPAWCRSLAEWEAQVDAWIEDPTWDHVRHLLIIADARAVAGSGRLAAALAERLRRAAGESPQLCAAMLRNTLHRQPVVGPLGNLLRVSYGPHAGGIEIKYGLYVPMVNAVRLLAVMHGVEASGTAERIAQLRLRGALAGRLADDALRDFANVLYFRSITASEGDAPQSSGIIAAPLLTRPVRERIRSAIATAKRLHEAGRAAVQQRGGKIGG